MAKLRLPLLSLEARGAIGESIVFFPWKGINAARKYVIPSNPKTTPQLTQRGYITAIVADIHTAMADVASPLLLIDTTAYALYSRTLGKTMTWFNALVRQSILQKVGTLSYAVFCDGLMTPGVDKITAHVEFLEETGAPGAITAATWYYGTSPTALTSTKAATIAGNVAQDDLTALTTGVKYYVQLRPTLAVNYLGTRSGIYSATAG